MTTHGEDVDGDFPAVIGLFDSSLPLLVYLCLQWRRIMLCVCVCVCTQVCWGVWDLLCLSLTVEEPRSLSCGVRVCAPMCAFVSD